MAIHRCFSLEIVDSDDFLDLPPTAQNLYFALGMRADDRGYVNKPNAIVRAVRSNAEDLEALIEKKFVLKRTGNLILIKGWKVNNSIQPSRLVETKYKSDFQNLFYDENNSYTETPTNRPCQQSADKLSTQDKLSKDKLSKDKLIDIERNNHSDSQDDDLTPEQIEILKTPLWKDEPNDDDKPF